MSVNPFAADPSVPARLERQDGVAAAAAALATATNGIVPAAAAREVAARFGLDGPNDLALHLLDAARGMARPPVSGFHVGAAGRATDGSVVLGANLEFPGSTMHHTVHGEGFVAVRAWQAGLSLASIAIGEAHPCAHCRQVLSEFAWGEPLLLVDPLGHRLALSDLYPWPFDPAALGVEGAQPGAPARYAPSLDRSLPPDVAEALLAEGRRAHAPYSGCPSVVALEHPGGVAAGAVLESVAFNPTLHPAQTALIALHAAGAEPSSVTRAWLAQPSGGALDVSRATADLLAAACPGATLEVVGWR